MAILVVVLVMLFLSTAVSTASKVNAKVRKTDVALTCLLYTSPSPRDCS